EMTDKMKALFSFPFEIFFYGKGLEEFKKYTEPLIQPESSPIPSRKEYPEPETMDKVYFVDYDMVQMEMAKVGKGATVDTKDFGRINVFNEYFGSGLSSIVFQQ